MKSLTRQEICDEVGITKKCFMQDMQREELRAKLVAVNFNFRQRKIRGPALAIICDYYGLELPK